MIGSIDLGENLGFGECGLLPQRPKERGPVLYIALEGEERVVFEGPSREPIEVCLKGGRAFLAPGGYKITYWGERLRLGFIELRGELLEEPELVRGCERAKLQRRHPSRFGGVDSKLLEEPLLELGLLEGSLFSLEPPSLAASCLESLQRPAKNMKEALSQMGLFYQLLGGLCEVSEEEPDFVLSREPDEITSTALEPNRQVETGFLEEESQRDTGYVQEAMEILRKSYQEGIQVCEVAGKIGISRSYLSAIFKRETGQSPQQYLMNYRMEEAVRLLRETNYPIKTVGARVGYADYLSFSKAFHRRYGKSPSAYRMEKELS